MRIAMVIAFEGFQDREFVVPKAAFLKRGASVDLFSTKKGTAVGSLGAKVKVALTLDDLKDEAKLASYDALLFVGGPGTPSVRSDSRVDEIVQNAVGKGLVVGAICWAPTILAKAGVLKGKKATVWPGDDAEYKMRTPDYLKASGANFILQRTVTDGRIVTADGPDSAEDFAQAVWVALLGRK